jgi:hypothetical protein
MLAMKGAPDHGDVGGNSSFENFQPGTISTRSIGRFRKVLAQRDIAFIQTCVKRDMISFDYPMEPVQFSPGDQSKFYLVDFPLNLMRLGGWLTFERIAEMKGRGVPDHRLKNGSQ